jgi:anti-anti-sigma regulatory factor
MGNVKVLTFLGDVDFSRKAWIDVEFGQLERVAPGTIAVIDLTAATFVDTALLNALLRVHGRLADVASKKTICIVTNKCDGISRLVQIAKLDASFRLFDDMMTALRFASSTKAATQDLAKRFSLN